MQPDRMAMGIAPCSRGTGAPSVRSSRSAHRSFQTMTPDQCVRETAMRRIPLLKNFASRACVAALALCATSAFALEHFNGVEPDAEHEALIANPYASSGSCGVERWSVKTGTDADVGSVNLTNPQTNTIVTLRSWTAPNPIPPNNRVSPYETTTWVL